MRIHSIPAKELNADLRQIWAGIQRSQDLFSSPYFCPGFTAAVAAVRANAEVGILEGRSGVEGFFPFERCKSRMAGPIGGRLSDYQGVIVQPSLSWTAQQLMAGCHLSIYEFDHLLHRQAPLQTHHRVESSSPIMDLSDGFEAYAQGRKASGSHLLRQAMRKARKLTRERGPIRFELQVDDPKVFHRALSWKSQQCQRTGTHDYFRLDPWTIELVERIWQTREEDFSGMLSALYVGDDLAAVHLGMRSSTDLHWWIPSYDHDYASYSPGLVLLIELAREAPGLGIETIDLGKGSAAYKDGFASDRILIAEGNVLMPSWSSAVYRLGHATRRFLRRSKVTAPVRPGYRLLRDAAQQISARVRKKSRLDRWNRAEP